MGALTNASPAAAIFDRELTAQPPTTGPLVVATDGSARSDAAFTAARLFAGRTNADVQVVTVAEPIFLPSPEWGIVPPMADMLDARRSRQLTAAREQLARVVSPEADWQVTVIDGEPASELARVAGESGARLMVLGRGRHSLAERVLLGETASRLLRLADVPVFAAEPTLTKLPSRIVVATDFSGFSAYAALVALSLADPRAVVYLAHVTPRLDLAPEAARWAESYEQAARAGMCSIRDALGLDRMQVELVTLTGRAGVALADFAEATKADLVVSGTHGWGFFNRLILGSVATDLLHRAPCSALIVPGAAVRRAEGRRPPPIP